MKKLQMFLVSILLLFSCVTSVNAMVDSQSTTVRYSVPATIVYRDYDGTSATQKVKVGTTLKAPEPKGKPGCVFEGWRDEKTGFLWDFTTSVTEHMTLTASYSEFQEDTDGNIPIGDGKFSVSIKIENYTTEASIGTSSKEILNMLLQDGSITSKEIEQLEAGASLEVVLVIIDGVDTVSQTSKEQMKQSVNDYTIGQYLDISLIKYFTVDGETGKGQLISCTSDMIEVSIKVSDYMINTDKNVERSYVVLRNHEGKVEILDSVYNADTQMLTFQTNLFSDYAIAYKDVQKPEQTNEAEDNPDQKQNEPEATANAVKTGDNSYIFGYEMLLLLSLSVMVGLLYTRKRNRK